MYKLLAVAVLCCVALQVTADSNDDDLCAPRRLLAECYPNFQGILIRAEGLSAVNVLNLATNSTGFLAKCPAFIQVGQCVQAKIAERGCQPTDANSVAVARYRAVRAAVGFICVDKAADFFENRDCLSSTRDAIQACADARDRNAADQCPEYREEVACVRRAAAACPIAEDFETFAGKILRLTPQTATC